MKIVVHSGMSLFDAPSGSCLIHACNCLGAWGKGIALEMREHFYDAYLAYKQTCNYHGKHLLGQSLIIPAQGYSVGCLFTSFAYGARKDPPEKILQQTQEALNHFLKQLPDGVPLYSCKFNSVNFGVAWEQTEALILEAKDERVWNVCEK